MSVLSLIPSTRRLTLTIGSLVVSVAPEQHSLQLVRSEPPPGTAQRAPEPSMHPTAEEAVNRRDVRVMRYVSFIVTFMTERF